MGRRPCCSKEGVKRGAWTTQEDKILIHYIRIHGEGKWRDLPQKAGLKRCGKSCRLRWLNYLRPDLKLGNISAEEEDLILRLHKLLGNRWSLIAGRLPGRTDNEIKNYWNTTLRKKLLAAQKKKNITPIKLEKKNSSSLVIRTKAVKCTATGTCNNFMPHPQQAAQTRITLLPSCSELPIGGSSNSFSSSSSVVVENDDPLMSFWMDSDISQMFSDDVLDICETDGVGGHSFDILLEDAEAISNFKSFLAINPDDCNAFEQQICA